LLLVQLAPFDRGCWVWAEGGVGLLFLRVVRRRGWGAKNARKVGSNPVENLELHVDILASIIKLDPSKILKCSEIADGIYLFDKEHSFELSGQKSAPNRMCVIVLCVIRSSSNAG
jgi:hypothetical protein